MVRIPLGLSRWLTFYPHSQPQNKVEGDLRGRGIQPTRLTISRLRRYPTQHYQQILNLIDQVRSSGRVIVFLKVDAPENVPLINFDRVPTDLVIKTCLQEMVLDLRGLHKNLLGDQVTKGLFDSPSYPRPSGDQKEAERVKTKFEPNSMEVGRPIETIRDRGVQVTREYDPQVLWTKLIEKFPGDVKRRGFRDHVSGRRVVLEILDLRSPSSLEESIKIPLGQCKAEISRQAWQANVRRKVRGYTPQYVEQHFQSVDREFLVRDPDSGEIVAFSGIRKIIDSCGLVVHMLEVSMVRPRYQNMRITTTLVGKLVVDAFIANGLKPITVAARTANPQVLASLQSLADVFPNPRLEAGPEEWQKKVFRFVAGYLNPGHKVNEDTFTIDDVYPMDSGLIAPPHRIPSYDQDPRIGAWCRQALEYDKLNSPDFYQGELQGVDRRSIDQTLQRISQGRVRLGQGLIEEELNQLVGLPGFYDLVKDGLGTIELRGYTRQLVEETTGLRAADFTDLDQDGQETIKYFNRMLLEDLCAEIPKRSARAMVVVGKFTTSARLGFWVRCWVERIRRAGLAVLRRIVNSI